MANNRKGWNKIEWAVILPMKLEIRKELKQEGFSRKSARRLFKLKMSKKGELDMRLIKVARDLAVKMHKDQPYGKVHSYNYHLSGVSEACETYRGYLALDDYIIAKSGCWLHDILEDTYLSYNDIKKELNEEIADVVFDVTEYRGKTRKERQPDAYYLGIRKSKLAVYVKLCDKMANVEAAVQEKSDKMMKMHKSEIEKFTRLLHVPGEYDAMWSDLWHLLDYEGV